MKESQAIELVLAKYRHSTENVIKAAREKAGYSGNGWYDAAKKGRGGKIMKVRHIKSGKEGVVIGEKNNGGNVRMFHVKYENGNGNEMWGLAANFDACITEKALPVLVQPVPAVAPILPMQYILNHCDAAAFLERIWPGTITRGWKPAVNSEPSGWHCSESPGAEFKPSLFPMIIPKSGSHVPEMIALPYVLDMMEAASFLERIWPGTLTRCWKPVAKPFCAESTVFSDGLEIGDRNLRAASWHCSESPGVEFKLPPVPDDDARRSLFLDDEGIPDVILEDEATMRRSKLEELRRHHEVVKGYLACLSEGSVVSLDPLFREARFACLTMGEILEEGVVIRNPAEFGL